MEESFVTEKELENFLKGMRQYTTGVHEDGNSEINNVKSNDSSMETKDTNVFATAAVLCMEHSSLTLFIDVGGRRMIIFDPMRRDNERSHETPNAGFFLFSTQSCLLQFLGRRMHESEAKWVQISIFKINDNRVASDYYSFLRNQKSDEGAIMTETKSFAETIKARGDTVNGSLINLIKGMSYKTKS